MKLCTINDIILIYDIILQSFHKGEDKALVVIAGPELLQEGHKGVEGIETENVPVLIHQGNGSKDAKPKLIETFFN